ncbi:NAD(P)H-binding protein [Streptomyces scopuliridis]|uniref:NmrA family NAD(P)-binding protein n=1 Tax=Streptomyces scopuliridis TaxID=452529 RepID=UPI00369C2B11
MSAPHPTTHPVLVVGATGALGGQVVDELLRRGKNVRALVRPASDASKLQQKGVEIARGDMLDVDSLIAAMTGADAVVTTAAGYTRGDKKARDIDTTGNANLAEAAHRAGVREVADLMGTQAGKTIKVRGVPSAITRAAGAVVGSFMPMVKDMAAMFRWFDSGRYGADTTRQAQLFGPVPSAENAIERLTAELSTPRRS